MGIALPADVPNLGRGGSDGTAARTRTRVRLAKEYYLEEVFGVLPAAGLGFDDDDDFLEGGGAKKKEDNDDDDESDDDSGITGKRFFLKRLMKADPVLFKEVNKKDGKVERYTRACPSMQQPVVISNEEKERIDTINRKSYVGNSIWKRRK